MSYRSRYFECYTSRQIIYDLWKQDRRVRWVAAPKPTMADHMYNPEFFKYGKTVDERMKMYRDAEFTSALNNIEVAFDAADMMKFGKDIFVRKGQSCNNKGLDWLRREFPDFRFHQIIMWNDYTRHADEALAPVRGPTGGSPGICFLH